MEPNVGNNLAARSDAQVDCLVRLQKYVSKSWFDQPPRPGLPGTPLSPGRPGRPEKPGMPGVPPVPGLDGSPVADLTNPRT